MISREIFQQSIDGHFVVRWVNTRSPLLPVLLIFFYIGNICKSHFKTGDTNERPLSHQWTLPFLSHNFTKIHICVHTHIFISLANKWVTEIIYHACFSYYRPIYIYFHSTIFKWRNIINLLWESYTKKILLNTWHSKCRFNVRLVDCIKNEKKINLK